MTFTVYDVFLFDEIYNTQNILEILNTSQGFKVVYCAVVNGSHLDLNLGGNQSGSHDDLFPTVPAEMTLKGNIVIPIHRIYLKSLHRNQFQVSRLTSKIRRLMDDVAFGQKTEHLSSLP